MFLGNSSIHSSSFQARIDRMPFKPQVLTDSEGNVIKLQIYATQTLDKSICLEAKIANGLILVDEYTCFIRKINQRSIVYSEAPLRLNFCADTTEITLC